MDTFTKDTIQNHIDGRHPEPTVHTPECPICVWVIEQAEQPIEVLSFDQYAVQA